MYLKEIWRYPVKSMAGERISETEIDSLGIAGDRKVLVRGANGRVISSRTRPKLLALKGTLGPDGQARISGHLWKSPEALALVRGAIGGKAELLYYEGPERFDILPLLVATDGAIAHMGFDGRRLRPNLVIGGVEGLDERQWPGRKLHIGTTVIQTVQLRGRCVMTTFDPETQTQDLNVLRKIVSELDGTMALDTAVISGGIVREGDPVTFLE